MDYRYDVLFPKQHGEELCMKWLRELTARGFILKPIADDSLTPAPSGIKVPANIETPASPATAPGLYPIGSAEEAAHAVALAGKVFPGAEALVRPIRGLIKGTQDRKPGFTLRDEALGGGWLYNYNVKLPRTWKFKVGDDWFTDRAKVIAARAAVAAVAGG